MFLKNLISDLGVCGQSLNAGGLNQQLADFTRVVGGINAEKGAWPWQAVLLLENVDVFSVIEQISTLH